jgi:hypothetical protein
MDNDKISYRRRRRTPLIALLGAVLIIVAVTPTAALATKQEIEDTINFTDEFLDDDMQEIGPLRFTPRWSEVESVAPKRIGVFFADCRPGEFPMSGQQILQSSQLRVIESYAVAMPDDFMSWVFAIKNNDDDKRKFLAVGAICAGESGVEPREPVVSSQEVNNIINNIVVIEEEGDVVQNIDINIDMKVNQAVEIRQTVNQIAVQVNNNGGNAQLVVNQIAQLATSDDIEQKAKVQQFLEQADPESPQFEETVQSLTRQSQQLQEQGPNANATGANATLVLPEPEPGVMTNQTSTEDLSDNATELQQQPMQPGLNATDVDNATTAGEDETGREFESLIENETRGASNFTEGRNFTMGEEGFRDRTTTSGDSNATTAGDDDDDQTTAETTDTAMDTTTGNMTTGMQAGEGNQTQQEDDDGRGLLDSLTEPFEDLFGGGR